MNALIILISLLITKLPEQFSERRMLLVFGTGNQQALVDEQLRIFREKAADCRERDLDIIQVSKLPEEEKLYKRHHIKPGEFQVLLIGKDGGEKFRSNQMVRPAAIFGLIDSMPMRQYEMRSKKDGNHFQ